MSGLSNYLKANTLDMGHWEYFSQDTDINSPEVKRLQRILSPDKTTSSRSQRVNNALTGSGKNAAGIIGKGPVYIFVDKGGEAASCITTDGGKYNNILGRETTGTVEPSFRPVIMELLYVDHTLDPEKTVERIQQMIEKGEKLDERDTLFVQSCFPFDWIKKPDEQEQRPSGGVGFGFSFGTGAFAAIATGETAANTGNKSANFKQGQQSENKQDDKPVQENNNKNQEKQGNKSSETKEQAKKRRQEELFLKMIIEAEGKVNPEQIKMILEYIAADTQVQKLQQDATKPEQTTDFTALVEEAPIIVEQIDTFLKTPEAAEMGLKTNSTFRIISEKVKKDKFTEFRKEIKTGEAQNPPPPKNIALNKPPVKRIAINGKARVLKITKGK